MNSCTVVHKHIGTKCRVSRSFESIDRFCKKTLQELECWLDCAKAAWLVDFPCRVDFLHVLHSIRLDASMLRLAGAKIPDLATALQVMLKGHEKCNVTMHCQLPVNNKLLKDSVPILSSALLSKSRPVS